MMRIIGEELNNGFFEAVSDKFGVDCEKLSEFFTEYFVINDEIPVQLPTSSNQKPRSRSKTPKKTEDLKVEKSKPKRKPSGKNELPRNEQSEIKFSDIANFTVANLITYNRERGLITSGNKAALKEPLEKYEIEHGNGPVDEGKVAEKKQKGKKKEAKVKISVEPEVHDVKFDEYGRAIAYDDLVCEKDEYGEYIVCGTIYEDGKVGKLTAEDIEKCKLNNIKYNIDNFAA